MTKPSHISRLLDIMAALRNPQTGCPWDIQQTFATIAPYTIEEAFEVADAIERGDLIDLKDELGDLLLQVVYHSRMAEEQGAFAFDDVAEAISQKMIRRHPHVFGTPEERAAGTTPGFWERLKTQEKAAKAAERAANGAADQPRAASLLDDTPASLPALTRAIKLQDKAARVGFDWPSLAPVFDKMREELAELEAEVSAPTAAPSDSLLAPSDSRSGSRPDGAKKDSAVEEEFGDLLFVMANVARHLKIDPEAALRAANAKFTRRFQHIEVRLAEKGSSPAHSSLEEMDRLWDEAKETEWDKK